MHVGLPEVIWVVLIGIALGGSLMKHGEPKDGEYNFGYTLIAAGLHTWLMYWGGFFDG